jgi:hypothetical protein
MREKPVGLKAWAPAFAWVFVVACGGDPPNSESDESDDSNPGGAGGSGGSSGSGGSGGSGAWPTSPDFTPAVPADPGYLDIGPPGLVLEPGATFELQVRLILGPDTAEPPGALAWEMLGEGIVVVSDGVVTALAEGSADVRAQDQAGRSATVSIDVSVEPPAGPTGISFEPPVIAVAPEMPVTVTATLWGADGQEIEGTPELFASNDAVVISDTTVSANHPGAALLGGRIDDVMLRGTAPVLSAPSGSGVDCAGDAGEIVGCSGQSEPYFFAQPGLDAPLRVFAWRSTDVSRCDGVYFGFSITEESPDEVRIELPSVVSGASDGLQALAPGFTHYETLLEGFVCGGSYAIVHPNLTGSWTSDCDGNTTSVVLSSSFPPPNSVRSERRASHLDGGGRNTESSTSFFRGTGCGDVPLCNGSAELTFAVSADWTTSSQLCSDDSPCAGLGLQSCAVSGGGYLLGSDSFTVGECTFQPGGSCDCSGLDCFAQPGEPCQVDADCTPSWPQICQAGVCRIRAGSNCAVNPTWCEEGATCGQPQFTSSLTCLWPVSAPCMMDWSCETDACEGCEGDRPTCSVYAPSRRRNGCLRRSWQRSRARWATSQSAAARSHSEHTPPLPFGCAASRGRPLRVTDGFRARSSAHD